MGPVGNLLADEFANTFFDDYNLRLDHQFNPGFKIYGSWTENRQNGRGRPINIREDMGMFDASQGRDAPFYNRNISSGGTWIVSPTIVNDARVGYYRRVNTTTVPGFQDNWAQKLGIPNAGPELVPGFGGSNTRSLLARNALWNLRSYARTDCQRNTLVPQRPFNHKGHTRLQGRIRSAPVPSEFGKLRQPCPVFVC